MLLSWNDLKKEVSLEKYVVMGLLRGTDALIHSV